MKSNLCIVIIKKGKTLKILSKVLIGLSAFSFACQTHHSGFANSKSFTKTEIVDSVATADLGPYSLDLDLFLGEPNEEELEYPSKDVTLTFSADDKYNVQTRDPKLFANNDVEIIDLSLIPEEDYAMPMKGARIVSRYAGRRKNHAGIDLAGRSRDPIYSTFDGVVRIAKKSDTYGNVIVVRHYNGLETVYSHNSKNMVKVGEEVKAGQQIAVSGQTGRAFGDHLHFEVRMNGQHFNPELVFNFKTNQLVNKNLYCVKIGNKTKVDQVDLPQYMLAHNRLSTESAASKQNKG